MESAKRRSQRDYTLTFKLSVVDQVEKVELSYKEAQERYSDLFITRYKFTIWWFGFIQRS